MCVSCAPCRAYAINFELWTLDFCADCGTAVAHTRIARNELRARASRLARSLRNYAINRVPSVSARA